MENVFADFLLTSGLYASIAIKEENISDLIELLKGNVRISSYCKECGCERVFTMKPIKYSYVSESEDREIISQVSLGEALQTEIFSLMPSGDRKLIDGWKRMKQKNAETTRLMSFGFVCSMDENHHLDFIVLADDSSLMKIGQYPSVADMTFPELDDYKHVISNQDRKELGTAIGLYANGVGAGSYVYLRRILERLVNQAKEDAGDNVDSAEFEKARIADRIRMLKDFLPDTLTQNTAIYGVLSKGIHELTEEECLKYFTVVQACIFQILGMRESIRKQQADEKAMSRALNAITTAIK